jgi:nucleotide-binding universal stress UspA family protein
MTMRIDKILVVAERASGSQAALQKAVMIARHFGAAIELFTCDAEHAYALGDDIESAAIVTRCLEESRRFLEALRGSISARDVDFTTAVACAATVGEGVCEHVQTSAPSLVVKSFTDAGVAPSPLPSITDLYLMRRCPVPLLLTHGRSWRPVPIIGVAFGGSVPSARTLRAAAEHLAEGCHGKVDTIETQRTSDVDVLALRVDGSELAEQIVGTSDCDLLLVPDLADG